MIRGSDLMREGTGGAWGNDDKFLTFNLTGTMTKVVADVDRIEVTPSDKDTVEVTGFKDDKILFGFLMPHIMKFSEEGKKATGRLPYELKTIDRLKLVFPDEWDECRQDVELSIHRGEFQNIELEFRVTRMKVSVDRVVVHGDQFLMDIYAFVKDYPVLNKKLNRKGSLLINPDGLKVTSYRGFIELEVE